MFRELVTQLPIISSTAIVGSLMAGVALLVLLGVGALWVSAGSSKRQRFLPSNRSARADQTADPLAGKSTDQLRLDVGEQLMAADQAVESSEQELLFASASYGDEAVAEFTEDVRQAKEKLSESFRLKYETDSYDAPEDAGIRERFARILALCEEIDSTLRSHAKEFDSMRDLENNPEPAITELAAELKRLDQARSSAEQTGNSLAGTFHPDALEQYQQNLQRLGSALETAQKHHRAAQDALAAASTAEAVLALHQGEEAAADARHLVDSLAQNAERITRARRNLDIGVEQTEQDIAQAQAVYDAGQGADLAGPIAAARAALERTQRALQNESERPIDPLRLLESLENAHRELDEPLNSVRDRQAKDRRARETIETELLTARHQVTSSQDYLRARRYQSSPEARTRMAEAQRLLEEANRLAESSPSRAVEQAREAKVLAVRAAQLAQTDHATEAMQSMGSGFGGYGGYGAGGYGAGGAAGRRNTAGFGSMGMSSGTNSTRAMVNATRMASRLMRQQRRR